MIKKDDRTPEEIAKTIGFVVATDKFMSGWGEATNGKSVIAVPFVSQDDRDRILKRVEKRSEMKRIRVIEGTSEYNPRLRKNDHLHIYDTIRSFRYSL